MRIKLFPKVVKDKHDDSAWVFIHQNMNQADRMFFAPRHHYFAPLIWRVYKFIALTGDKMFRSVDDFTVPRTPHE